MSGIKWKLWVVSKKTEKPGLHRPGRIDSMASVWGGPGEKGGANSKRSKAIQDKFERALRIMKKSEKSQDEQEMDASRSNNE